MEETQDRREAEQVEPADQVKPAEPADPAEPAEAAEQVEQPAPAAPAIPGTPTDPMRRTADALGRLLPDRAAEDEPRVWGDPSDDSDARFLDDVPPHHGS